MKEAELSANKKSLERFLENIKSYKSTEDNFLWKDVPREQVLELLNKYLSPPRMDIKFNREGLTEYIKKSSKLAYWDISIPQGDKKGTRGIIGEIEYSPLIRSSDKYKNNTLRVGKSRCRVRDANFTKAGLDKKVSDAISAEFIKKNPDKKTTQGEEYLIPDRNPLLMLYFIEPIIDGEKIDTIYYGIGLAFPKSSSPYGESIEKDEKVRYVWNQVKLEEEGFLEDEGDDDDEI